MKNRVLLLCLKNHIEYAEELALNIGVSIDTAKQILKEEIEIPEDIVKRICNLFNVTREYLLCLV